MITNTKFSREPLCILSYLGVVSDSAQPYGLSPARLLCPWASPGQNTGGGCNTLQGIFPTLCLPHCRQILHHWSHLGSPKFSTVNIKSVNVYFLILRNNTVLLPVLEGRVDHLESFKNRQNYISVFKM